MTGGSRIVLALAGSLLVAPIAFVAPAAVADAVCVPPDGVVEAPARACVGTEPCVYESLTGYYMESCDVDGDGYSVADGDCDDDNSAVNPGAPEIMDGVDNDCDGLVDEEIYFRDKDRDAYGDPNEPIEAEYPPPEGLVWNDLDCDDSNRAIHPDAIEVEDGVDNDCDGLVDE